MQRSAIVGYPCREDGKAAYTATVSSFSLLDCFDGAAGSGGGDWAET